MGTLIDKLNYLNDTKQIFKNKAVLCGQYFNDNIHFRNYFDWINPLCNAAQEYGGCSGISGGTIQTHFPTQNNPSQIQTSIGECLIVNAAASNWEGLYNNIPLQDGWSYHTEAGNDLNYPSAYVYWANEEESSIFYNLPWTSAINDQVFIKINYTFSLGNLNFTPQPFKIYIMDDEGNSIEIYDSQGASSGQFCYSYTQTDYSDKILKFQTTNEENIAIIFPEAEIIVKKMSIAKNIDLKDKELVSFYNQNYNSYRGDDISLNRSQNYFNKDDENYIIGGQWQYVEPELEYDEETGESSYSEDPYYIITPDSSEDYTITSLDTGVRFSCKKTTGSCNIIYQIQGMNPIAHGGGALVQSLINIVGDRIPKIGIGRLISTNPLKIDWYTETSIIDNNKILVQDGYPALEYNYPFVVVLFCDAGANATENDYIDFTNLQCFNWLSIGDNTTELEDNQYVPYQNGYFKLINGHKGSTKRIFNGTENGWTCTSTSVSGVYAMELAEDSNDPWYGYHTQEEEEEWDEEQGDYIHVLVNRYGASICSHFLPVFNRDKIAPGYFNFCGDHVTFYTTQQTSLQEWLDWLEENPITLYYETGHYDEVSEEYETGIPGEIFKIDNPVTKQDISNIDTESITETVNKWLYNLENSGSSSGN